MEDRQLNSLQDFTNALRGPELSAANAMQYNLRFSSITLNRALLTETYAESGICQTLIDQPVDDAFRGGIIIKCDEFSPDDIKDMQAEMNRIGLIHAYKMGLKWKRLFGGAGILINAGQNLMSPLSLDRIHEKTPLKFYGVDRWELSYMPDGAALLDQFAQSKIEFPYNYYGHFMHETHVVKLIGKEAPSLIRGNYGGWGMSELERVVRNYNAYLKHQNVTYELLDEAKVDVFKVQGFNAAICTKDGVQKTAGRVQAAAQIKNFQNALVIDSQDDYQTKSVTFSGLAEILEQIRVGLACDLRMPMTKLFGLSPAGFSNGDSDLENYNAMIETEIRTPCKPGLIYCLQILAKKLFGYVPETLDFEYHPLRVMTHQEQSQVKNDELNRIVSAFNSGLMPAKAAVEQINAAKIFTIDLNPNEAMEREESMGLFSDNKKSDDDKE